MQAEAAGLNQWLNQFGVTVRREWSEACVNWIVREEGPNVPQSVLHDLAYKQWQHADLREVVEQSSIPKGVIEQQNCHISGRFIVQIDSLIDVGMPAYGQLQKLKGHSLDLVEPSDDRKVELKPTRVLLMNLTDGVREFQGMEYQPIPQLSVEHVLPGAKLQLNGNIQCRLGVLLLCPSHIQVLGGTVKHLLEKNEQRKLLARALNNENLANDGCPPTEQPQSSTESLSITSRQGREEAYRWDVKGPSSQWQHSTEASMSKGGSFEITEGSPPMVRDKILGTLDTYNHDEDHLASCLDEVDMDLSEFDDFNCEEECQQSSVAVAPPSNTAYGEEQMLGDAHELEFHTSSSSCALDHESATTSMGIVQGTSGKLPVESATPYLEPRPTSESQGSVVDSRPKVDGSLVAFVRPIASEEVTVEKEQLTPLNTSSSDGLTQQPILHIPSLSELQSPTLWQRYRVVKVKAHFVRVVKQLSYDTGVWMLTIQIGDGGGNKLKIHVDNKILEELLGFSAYEFGKHMKPNRSDPEIRLRASKGFKRCQTALADLDCFMELRKRQTHECPFVERILDT